MITIGDLMNNVDVQGYTIVNKIEKDDVVTVYEGVDGLNVTEGIEPYLDKEMAYLYVDMSGALCIEYREEE